MLFAGLVPHHHLLSSLGREDTVIQQIATLVLHIRPITGVHHGRVHQGLVNGLRKEISGEGAGRAVPTNEEGIEIMRGILVKANVILVWTEVELLNNDIR